MVEIFRTIDERLHGPVSASVLPEIDAGQREALRAAWFAGNGPHYLELGRLLREYGYTGNTAVAFQELGVQFQREFLEAYPNAQRDFVQRMVAACLAGVDSFPQLKPPLDAEDFEALVAALSDSIEQDDRLFVRDVAEFSSGVESLVDSFRKALGLTITIPKYQRAAFGAVRETLRRFLKTELAKIPECAPQSLVQREPHVPTAL